MAKNEIPALESRRVRIHPFTVWVVPTEYHRPAHLLRMRASSKYCLQLVLAALFATLGVWPGHSWPTMAD